MAVTIKTRVEGRWRGTVKGRQADAVASLDAPSQALDGVSSRAAPSPEPTPIRPAAGAASTTSSSPVSTSPPRSDLRERGEAHDPTTKHVRKKTKRKRKAEQTLDNLRPDAVDTIGGASTHHTDGSDGRVGRTEGRATGEGKKAKKRKRSQLLATGVLPRPAEPSGVKPSPCPLPCTSKVDEYTGTDAHAAAGDDRGSGSLKDRILHPARENRKSKKKKKKKTERSNGRVEESEVLSRRPAEDTNIGEVGGAEQVDERSHDLDDRDTERNDVSENLEGVMHAGSMYLVDARRRVFATERDERGHLRQVGTFDDHSGGVVFLPLPDPSGDQGMQTEAETALWTDDATARGDVRNELSTGGSSKGGEVTGKRERKKQKKKKNHDEGDGGVAGQLPAGPGMRGPRERGNGRSLGVVPEEVVPEIVKYPFEAEERDHCETSERAYSDIATLLTALAGELGKDAKELVIYDPYFCQGSVVERLASLGFPRVHNRNEDFYEVVRTDKVPEHDVVVTNPPFSGDHVPEILRFCTRQGAKPWFLLLPNYVYLKDYFESSLTPEHERGAMLPFYLTPPKRYTYYSPQGSRLKVKSSDRKTSPFNTFWYIRLGEGGFASKILQVYDSTSRKLDSEDRCCIARTAEQIPYKMMDSNDPRRKKARDRQRSIDRIRKKKSEWVVR